MLKVYNQSLISKISISFKGISRLSADKLRNDAKDGGAGEENWRNFPVAWLEVFFFGGDAEREINMKFIDGAPMNIISILSPTRSPAFTLSCSI